MSKDYEEKFFKFLWLLFLVGAICWATVKVILLIFERS